MSAHAEGADPADLLPVEELDGPLLAVKLATISGVDAPRVRPLVRTRAGGYGVAEPVTARCRRRHLVPDPGCECGFHAVADVGALVPAVRPQRDAVLLDVELGGTVVEHERGYRAEQQLVLGVRVPDRCFWCDAPAAAVVPGRRWRSACTTCRASRRRRNVSLAEAAARLGTSVVFAALPSEPRLRHRLDRARAALMWALAYVTVVAAVRRHAPDTVVAGTLVGAAMSLLLAGLGWRLRTMRQRTHAFVAQCAVIVACSLLLAGAG